MRVRVRIRVRVRVRVSNPNPNPNQVDDFAAAFKKKAPLKWEVGSDKAYEQIDRMQLEICEVEGQAAELQEREA